MQGKNVIAFEYKKGERIYTFSMETGSPLGEAYEASAEFMAHMVNLINEHLAKSMPKEPEPEKAEDSPKEE